MTPRSPSPVSASGSASASGSVSASGSASAAPDLSQVAAIVTCPREWTALRVWSLAALPAPCSSGCVVVTLLERIGVYDPAWGPTGLIAFSLGRDILFLDQAGGPVTNLTASLTQNIGEAMNPTWVSGCVNLP